MAEKRKTMRDKLEDLTAPLSLEDDIELRIGNGIKEGKGFPILAYKNSRVDVKRLNRVFGVMWSSEFIRDNQQNLRCKISVYNTEIEQWVGREGVGVPSYNEKIKGESSDALKRAGFRWGIGLELYDMPFMWINWDDRDKWFRKNDKMYPKAYPQNWKLRKNDSGNLYIITNYGEVVWEELKKGKSKPSHSGNSGSSGSQKTSRGKSYSDKSSSGKKKTRKPTENFDRMNKIPMGYEEGTRWKNGKSKNIKWIADHIKSEWGNRAKMELEVRDILRRIKSSFPKKEVADAKHKLGITRLNDIPNLEAAKKMLAILEPNESPDEPTYPTGDSQPGSSDDDLLF